MEGVVIKSTGSWYQVYAKNTVYQCRLRGIFKLKEERKTDKKTNPVAVGDRVIISQEANQDVWIIEEIFPRENYIIRKATNLSMGYHVLAANIDCAFLIVTLHSPKTSLGFIDRFLVTAESYRIPVLIVFNKSDLYDAEDFERIAELKILYENLGYKCLTVSGHDPNSLEALKEEAKDKVVLLSGHSGSGKSTLINQLIPGLNRKTSEISEYSAKGTHTTTFAEMFVLNESTFLIDTPGIKELGIAEIEQHELSHFFPEMRELMNNCKFNNCSHTNEPGCAVLDALEKGDIALSRFDSYLSMYLGEDNRK